jgi:hypothetical protein
MRRIHERIVGHAGLARRRWRTVLSGKALGVSTRSTPEYARVPLDGTKRGPKSALRVPQVRGGTQSALYFPKRTHCRYSKYPRVPQSTPRVPPSTPEKIVQDLGTLFAEIGPYITERSGLHVLSQVGTLKGTQSTHCEYSQYPRVP